MDRQLAHLLDFLNASGQTDRTLVVAVGDHGEGLGEHDEETHLYLLYKTTLHVPMLARLPRRIPGGR